MIGGKVNGGEALGQCPSDLDGPLVTKRSKFSF